MAKKRKGKYCKRGPIKFGGSGNFCATIKLPGQKVHTDCSQTAAQRAGLLKAILNTTPGASVCSFERGKRRAHQKAPCLRKGRRKGKGKSTSMKLSPVQRAFARR